MTVNHHWSRSRVCVTCHKFEIRSTSFAEERQRRNTHTGKICFVKGGEKENYVSKCKVVRKIRTVDSLYGRAASVRTTVRLGVSRSTGLRSLARISHRPIGVETARRVATLPRVYRTLGLTPVTALLLSPAPSSTPSPYSHYPPPPPSPFPASRGNACPRTLSLSLSLSLSPSRSVTLSPLLGSDLFPFGSLSSSLSLFYRGTLYKGSDGHSIFPLAEFPESNTSANVIVQTSRSLPRKFP